jgi:hypothetical protein
MAPEDRALAERVHVTVTRTALELTAGDLVRDARLREPGRQGRRVLPGRGRVQPRVCDAGLVGVAANSDDGELCPVSYALR